MALTEAEARGRLEAAAQALLDEELSPDRITVRALAERAGVALGLVNYHFGSKDRLLSSVIGRRMAALANDAAPGVHAGPPKQRLAALVEKLYHFGAKYPALMQFMVRQGFDAGDYSAALTLIPILREIAGPKADEMHLRVIALQILMPIQATCLAPAQFHLYSGIDINHTPDRDRFVECLMDHLLFEADTDHGMKIGE